jgi:hypothetical protein
MRNIRYTGNSFKEVLIGLIHREGRLLSFYQVVVIGNPPTPHPQTSGPSPLVPGEGHTRWRERGLECHNSDEGTYIHCGTL